MLARIKTAALELKTNKQCTAASAEFKGKQLAGAFVPFLLEFLSDADKKKIIADADRVLDGEYQIYNFAPYRKLDWRTDPQSGHKVPSAACTSLIKTSDLYGRVDIKNYWEQSHLHPIITLAQAFTLTADEKYAEKAVSLMCDFIGSEPCGKTVCWKCPMDAAIRLANIVECSALISESKAFAEKCGVIAASVCEHTLYICANYENKGKFPNNHYLSDLTGVIFGAAYLYKAFGSERFGAVLDKALSDFAAETKRQVNPDGSDYENSTYYHCFVTELLAESVSMLELNGITFPEELKIRSQKMLDVCKALGAFDGALPLIGDQDGSRLFHKKGCFDIDRCSFSELANLYEGTETGSAEGMGVYILADEHWRVYFKCGKTGTGGKGTHDHNDQLSISAFYDGASVIADSGTYCYTLDEKERKSFRSVQSHSTVYCGCEQGDISSCFALTDGGTAVIESAQSDTVCARFEYADGTVHKRTVSLKDGKLIINDEASCENARAIYILSGTDAVDAENGLTVCFADGKIKAEFGCEAELTKACISKAYGIKEETVKIEVPFRCETETVIQRA